MKMIKQPTIPPMPKQPTFDARDTQYNLPIGTDLISRQAAIDALRTCYDTETISMDNGDEYINYEDAVGEIEQLPPAEPKIVRCKDCKHWIPYDWMFREVWQSQNIDDYPEDEISCNYCDVHMKSNDFCSRAERREVTT